MTSVCFDALADHSHQFKYASRELFACIIRANNLRE